MSEAQTGPERRNSAGRVLRACLFAWAVGSLLAPVVMFVTVGGPGGPKPLAQSDTLDILMFWPIGALMALMFSFVPMLLLAFPLSLAIGHRLGTPRWLNALIGGASAAALILLAHAITRLASLDGLWPFAALYGAATGFFVTRRQAILAELGVQR